MKSNNITPLALGLALALGTAASFASAKGFVTAEDAQITALGEAEVTPLFTIGEDIDGFYPAGIPDGMGALRAGRYVKLLVNQELGSDVGYPYSLANGTELTGARVTSFDLKGKKHSASIERAGLAYHTIYNRDGEVVDEASDLENGGLNRLCSARVVARGERGFVDDIFLTGEEGSDGTEWALDVKEEKLWAAPALGRAAWEAVAPVETGDRDTIGLVIGDDEESAPLYYYVGNKKKGGFLERNGLAEGALYCWAADSGELSPEDFSGTGNSASGTFQGPLTVQDTSMAGQPGYDSAGYALADTLRSEADDLDCFSFSRPEDVHENPAQPTQVVLASTGRGNLFPSDNWGTLYVFDIDPSGMTADVRILLDSDDQQFRDFSVRSPDNLTWSKDGMVYVQEDRSTARTVPKDAAGCDSLDPVSAAECRDDAFGGRSKVEASIWAVDPAKPVTTTLDIHRIATVNRQAIPDGQEDTDPLDIGDWETSGIIDVTDLFPAGERGETLLMGNVQAHSLRGGNIDAEDLVQGGQIFFLTLENDDVGSDNGKGKGKNQDRDDRDD